MNMRLPQIKRLQRTYYRLVGEIHKNCGTKILSEEDHCPECDQPGSEQLNSFNPPEAPPGYHGGKGVERGG